MLFQSYSDTALKSRFCNPGRDGNGLNCQEVFAISLRNLCCEFQIEPEESYFIFQPIL